MGQGLQLMFTSIIRIGRKCDFDHGMGGARRAGLSISVTAKEGPTQYSYSVPNKVLSGCMFFFFNMISVE